MKNKALQIATFEINLNLATIPANRQWVVNPVAPRPFFQLPLNKNVLVKKIEATVDMGVLAPNNNIIVSDYQILFRLMEFNGQVLGISRGLIFNPTAGGWQVSSSTFDTIALSMSNPHLDFEDGVIMGGLELWDGNQIILSNTTTTLPAIARFYVNVYFIDIDNESQETI
jgi:hypothetical protein